MILKAPTRGANPSPNKATHARTGTRSIMGTETLVETTSMLLRNYCRDVDGYDGINCFSDVNVLEECSPRGQW